MLKNVASIQIQKVATFGSYKNQFNSKQIIQILQPIVIDLFLTHCIHIKIIFHKIFDFFLDNISLTLDFRIFLENMKMSSSLSKTLETGINVFKSNYQIIKKNIMK